MATQDVLFLTPEELRSRRAQGEAIVFLDVRTEAAVSVHPHQIPGTRWIPLADVVEQAETLPRDHTIAAY